MRRISLAMSVVLVVTGISTTAWATIKVNTTRPAAPAVNLDAGLVGWWKFDSNTLDSSVRGLNGTALGTPQYVIDRKGRPGSAFSFNGNGTQFVNFGNNSAFSASDLTMAAWVNPNSVTGLQEILAKEMNYKIRLNGTSLNLLVGPTGSAWAQTPNWTNVFSIGTWTHVAVTINGTTATAYVNGTSVGSVTVTAITAHNANNLYAATYNAGGETLNGALDDVRFYNRALSAAEVAALTTSSGSTGLKVGGGERGLVGWWKLDGDAKDASPYANNGTVTAAIPTNDRLNTADSAYAFDGSTTSINVPVNPNLNNSVFTFVAWVKPIGTQTGTIIGSASNGGPQFRIQSSGSTQYFLTLLQENVYQLGSSSASGTLGQWAHVAVTYDAAGTAVYYLNGVNIGTTTNLRTWTFSSLRIGRQNSALESFNGSVDDVRVYNRVLTTTEIAAQANQYGSSLASGNLQKGLIGYWPMNNNAKDATPFANNGNVSGPTLVADRKGRANSAYSFDGLSGYIQLSNGSRYSFPDSTFTVSTWVASTSGSGFMIGNGASGGGWGIRGDGALYLKHSSNNQSIFENNVIQPVLNNGNWHHLVFVVTTSTTDAAGVKALIYFDGAPVAATRSGMLAYSAHSDLRLGRRISGDNWPGSLDDVRIYNRGLSATEVVQLYAEYR